MKTEDDIVQFTGNFLSAPDLDKDVTVTISAVSKPDAEKDATGKVIDKRILTFSGAKKRLILNKINSQTIALMYGKSTTGWIGKPVTLTVRYLKTAFGQSNVPVIRVVPSDEHPMTFGMRKNYGSATPFTSGK